MHRTLPKDFLPKTLTIKLTKTGKRFLFITGEAFEPMPYAPCPMHPIGIDMGLERWATLSDGSIFENPRVYRKYERKLKKASRRMAKRKKASKGKRRASGWLRFIKR